MFALGVIDSVIFSIGEYILGEGKKIFGQFLNNV